MLAGESHAIAFSQLPYVEVAALWSRTRTTAERLAQQLSQSRLQIFDNWQELIEQASVDVISITTPPMLGREPVLAALEKGCHVLIEKPFSVGLTDAQAMIQAVNSANTVTATCFNWRYAPAYQVAWRAVIASLSIKSDADFPIEGGLHMHLAKLTNGILGDFRFTVTPGEDSWEFVLSGDEGTFVINHGDAIRRQRADENDPVLLAIPEPDQVPAGVSLIQYTWDRLIADFVQAIRQGDVAHKSVPHLPTAVDGLRCQEIIAGARISNEEMRWVSLTQLANVL